MCWLTTSGYIIFIIPWLIIKIYDIKFKKNSVQEALVEKKFIGHEEKKLFIVVGLLSPVWMFSGYTWFLSLSSTSVTANTIISNSGFLWSFLLSAILLQERISTMKVLSCVFCFVGLLLATISGDNSEEEGITQTWLGYALAILAAILNSVYDVMFKKFGPMKQNTAPEEPVNRINESLMDSISVNSDDSVASKLNFHLENQVEKVVTMKNTLFFLTFTGIFVFLLFWPGMILLNYTGTEPFEMPDGSTSFLLFLNVLLDVASNFGILLAVSYTTPFFTDIGILLTIPISIVFDVLVHDYLLPWFGWFGLLFLILGFVFILFADSLIDYREKVLQTGGVKRMIYFVLSFSSAYFTVNALLKRFCFTCKICARHKK